MRIALLAKQLVWYEYEFYKQNLSKDPIRYSAEAMQLAKSLKL